VVATNQEINNLRQLAFGLEEGHAPAWLTQNNFLFSM
jgi:hypothetical protein